MIKFHFHFQPHIFALAGMLILNFPASAQSPDKAEWYELGYEMGLHANPLERTFGADTIDSAKQIHLVLKLLGTAESEVSAADMNIIKQGWNDATSGSPAAIQVPAGPLLSVLPEKLQKARANSAGASGVFDVELVSKLKKAVVMIRTGSSHGSGFFIAPGKILTNRHVIEKVPSGGSVTVVIEDDREVSGKVFARSDNKDLAIIAINDANHAILKLGDSDMVKEGMALALFGYPLLDTLNISFNPGTVSSIGIFHKGEYGDEKAIKVDITANPGNSGGPLVDLEGRVCAVLTFGYDHITKSKGFTFGVSINEAAKLISEFAPEVHQK